MRIKLDRIITDESELLGTGRRVEIWFHGCSRDCPGCITADHNHTDDAMLELSVKTLFEYIQQVNNIEGVTISGGEPFLQENGLLELVRLVRSKELGIIIYSGFTHEELLALPHGREILGCVDVLIDGQYVQELDDGRPFRGSSNQVIHHFTERYRDFFTDSSRKRECVVAQRGIYFTLTGIPTEESKALWKLIKRKEM